MASRFFGRWWYPALAAKTKTRRGWGTQRKGWGTQRGSVGDAGDDLGPATEGNDPEIGYMAGKTGRTGRTSTLIGLKVAPERVEASAAVMNRSNNVTHDYLRDHEFNLWFTLGAPDRDSLEKELAMIIEEVGPLDWIELPSVRVFKLNSPSGSA